MKQTIFCFLLCLVFLCRGALAAGEVAMGDVTKGDADTGTADTDTVDTGIVDTGGVRPLVDVPDLMDAVAGPAPQQAATQPALQPQTGAQRTLAEFIGHFSPYQPMYFIAGGGGHDPLVKFQFSFEYRFFNPDSPVARRIPILGKLNFAYTQLSLWELNRPSAPFYDTNYMPEFFYSDEDIRGIKFPAVSQLGFQGGYAHDSNGQGGTTSRGVNMLFIRPIVTFGDPEGFHFYVAPRGRIYLGQLYGNGDIADYWGYCDLRTVVGWRQGLELSFLGRLGRKGDRGTAQVDLTYPLRDALGGNFDVYLDAQYFNGYGESLLEYNQHSQVFRVGLALVR